MANQPKGIVRKVVEFTIYRATYFTKDGELKTVEGELMGRLSRDRALRRLRNLLHNIDVNVHIIRHEKRQYTMATDEFIKLAFMEVI